jgi:hypothetical protein
MMPLISWEGIAPSMPQPEARPGNDGALPSNG